MPLSYDSLVNRRGDMNEPPDPRLCSVCSKGAEPTPPHVADEESRLLDLIFSTYRGNRVETSGVVADLLRKVPQEQPGARFDGVVLYSGGKDSSWMLKELACRDLRLVAWMLDQGYQSPHAISNARSLCDQLGIELVIAKPEQDSMNTLFRLGFDANREDDPQVTEAVMSYGSACWPRFSTISAQASMFCHDNDIPSVSLVHTRVRTGPAGRASRQMLAMRFRGWTVWWKASSSHFAHTLTRGHQKLLDCYEPRLAGLY
jgi:hypothetical protein